MATTNIAAEIQNITGVTTANAQFLISAQKFVAASVPKNLLKWAATATVPGNHGGNTSDGVKITMPIGTDSILDVSRNGFSGTEVPYNMKGFIANTASLYLATNTYPKYYLDDANPGEGVRIIVKPIPTDSETAIALYVDFSKIDDDCDLRNAVIYKASSQEFEKLGSDELPTISISAVPPDVPSLSTISFSQTNALAITATNPTSISLTTVSYTGLSSDEDTGSVSDVTHTTLDISGATQPAYNSSEVVGLTDEILTADMIGTALSVTDLTVAAVPPDTPSDPSFTVTTISEGTIHAGSVASVTVGTGTTVSTVALSSPSIHSNTVPSYADQSIPTARGTFNDFFESGSLNPLDDSDPGAFAITAVPPDAPSIASIAYSSASNNDASATGVSTATASEMTIVDVSSNAPTYTPPKVGGATEELTAAMTALGSDALATDVDFLDFSDWFTALGEMIEDEEDTELAQAQIGKISTYIQAYGQAMQNQLNEFNEGNARYQMEFQEAVTKENQDLQVAIANANNLAQEYRQEAQQSTQIDQFNKQQDQALNLANAAKAMEDDIADNDSKIQKYGAEIQAYQAEVGSQVQEYTQKLQRYSTELSTVYQAWAKTESDNLQLFQVEIQNELNNFNEANAVYQAALQEEVQNLQVAAGRVQQQAQIEIQEVIKQADVDISDAQKEADMNLQTSIQNTANDLQAQIESNAKTLEKDIQEYANTLGKYGSEIQEYQAEVGAEVQEWQANTNKDLQVWQQTQTIALQEHSQRMQDALNLFNEENAEYQAEVQEKIQQAQINNQENLQNMQKDLQIAIRDADKSQEHQIQEKIQDTQSIIADNQRKIAQFSAEAQHYATQVNEDVQAYTSQLQIDVQQMQGEIATEQNKLAKYQAEIVEYQAEVAAETVEYQNKIQKQQVYSKESDKYYQWANAEIQMYIQNNSKMISRNIAAQAATQQQRAD